MTRRPGGSCLLQNEFNLPLYSWYPSRIKRRCEQIAATSRPELANYATYPAVSWFTYSELSRYLKGHGFDVLDRFDLIQSESMSWPKRVMTWALQHGRFVKPLASLLTPYTLMVARKRGEWPDRERPEQT